MGIQNHNWYNAQASRKYPLDDNATGIGDAGERLPDGIIVDCNLQWPRDAGQYAFLCALTVSPQLLTAVFMAADTIDDTAVFAPLASITLMRPIQPYVHYPVQALYPGAGGFVVFEDVTGVFSGRFSTPRQGILAPKCCRPYDPLPVTSLRKHGRLTGLTGLVNLQAGPDVEIVKEAVNIEGVTRDAIVIRLSQSTADRNLLKYYSGPCNKRPESRNCDKEGIETVNGVKPDCDGNLQIEFRNLTPAPYGSCGSIGAGVTLDQPLGIDDVCIKQTTQVPTGQDQCHLPEISSSEGDNSDTLSSDTPSSPSNSESVSSASDSEQPCLSLPYLELFDGENAEAYWQTAIGNFAITAGDSPAEPGDSASLAAFAYTATELSQRNVGLLTACGLGDTVSRTVRTHAQIHAVGSRFNAGLVLNYRIDDANTNPHPVYFFVVLDRNVGKLRILRFNGGTFVEEAAVSLGAGVVFEHWYEIETTVEASGGGVSIDATVRGITDPGWPDASCAVLSNRYLPADGRFGVGTDRGNASFAFFELEEA